MTIPTSTAPAAKAYLLDLLEDNLTADPTATFGVFYDNAPAPNAPQDTVWVSDIQQRRLTPWAMVGDKGSMAYRENYLLTVVVNCYRGGDQAQIVEERAWALATAIETLVRTDPTFGGLLLNSDPQDSSSVTSWNDEATGRFCQIPLTVACLAAL